VATQPRITVNGVGFIQRPDLNYNMEEEWLCLDCHELGIVRILKFEQFFLDSASRQGHREDYLRELFGQHAREHQNPILKDVVERLRVRRQVNHELTDMVPVEIIEWDLEPRKPKAKPTERKLNFE